MALGGFLFTSIFAVSAPLVKAGCQQWSANGKWTFIQGSLSVSMDLRQNGTVFTGIARFQAANEEVKGYSVQKFVAGSVDGTLEGNHFAMHVHWSNDTTGVYDGTIRPSGKIEGTGYEQRSPSIKVNWYSETRMVCTDAATTTAPAPVAPPPIKSSGKAKPAAAPAVSPGWAGRWESRTAQGGHFEIIFVQNGDNVRGAFTDLNGNPQYNGSLSGEISGSVLLFEYTQPGIDGTGKGMFELGSSGKVITGNGVANDAARTKFKWWGWKTN